MKKNPKHEVTLLPPQAEPDMAVLMAKMQQQLLILDKKLDSLINQFSERPFRGEHYSKPFQRIDHYRRREKRDQGNSYGERRFTQAICAECKKECEVPFKPVGDRPVYCKDCFSRRKQGGSFKGEYDKAPGREVNFTQRQYSGKKQSRKNHGHGGKKPVSRRRK